MDTKEGFRFWLAALVFLGLAACSNGSGSLSDPSAGGEPPPTVPPPPTPPPTTPPPTPPPPPPPPGPATPGAGLAGYWKGTVRETDGHPVHQAVAMIDHEGETQFLVLAGDSGSDDPQFVLHGNLCCDTSSDTDDLGGRRFLSSRNEEAELDVERAGNQLIGTLEFRRRDYQFNLSFSSEYTSALTLQTLAGVYTQTLGSSTLTLTIDPSGQITGSHTNGCVVNGTVSIPESARNMVELNYDMTGCGEHFGSSREWNGRYGGVGLLLPNAPMEGTPSRADVFYHSTVGPTWLGPQTVGR